MSAAQPSPLGWRRAGGYALVAVLCFQAAYTVPTLGFLIFPYVACVAQLARLTRALHAFAAGLLTGLGCVAPQLAFFYGIFGAPAFTLWAILSAWIAAFVTLLHFTARRLPTVCAALVVPFLWTGLEFFRSELYPLRFSWLNVGYALSAPPAAALSVALLGVYGCGFLAAALASGTLFLRGWRVWVVAGAVAWLASLPLSDQWHPRHANCVLAVAGIQQELPSTALVLESLDLLAQTQPEAPLYVLSEYTLDGPVPDTVRRWCREHGKHLIVGGKAPLPGGRYHNTAFVVGVDGEIVFQQAKSVPIQFFDDGLPAPSQSLWASPWGKIGLCICYDLSYRRVTDRLAALGAVAIIVPTMDADSWGEHEHRLHTRIAPARAAEYRIPVFRLASSGISQAVNASGAETASAGFPGQNAVIAARLRLGQPAALPLDRFLVWPALVVTVGTCLWLVGLEVRTGRLFSFQTWLEAAPQSHIPN